MTSATKCDDHTWLIVPEPHDHHPTLCLSMNHAGVMYQINLFPLSFDPPAGGYHKVFFLAEPEIFSTFLYTATPVELLEVVVQELLDSADMMVPIELVYKFGGTLMGETPLFFLPKPKEVH